MEVEFSPRNARGAETSIGGITKGEVLAALSRALDLVEGQPAGHSVRTLWIAMRLAEELQLDPVDQEALYFASLLKDSGCSNNSVRFQALFKGDDQAVKGAAKTYDWSSKLGNVLFGLRYIDRGAPILQRIQSIAKAAGDKGAGQEIFRARCTRGAEIARRLGLPAATSEAIYDLDEHWDGKGACNHKRGANIHSLARILGLAQTLEVFVSSKGLFSAYSMLERRAGRWFDPVVVDAAFGFRNDDEFWGDHLHRLDSASLAPPPLPRDSSLDSIGLDAVCEAFAMIVDAKSAFTAEHSSRVTQYAVELASDFGFSAERKATLRRAALLHDIGKLGVSTAILEKPDRLTDDEFRRVKDHPRHSYEILAPIPGFKRLADLAGAHHERLDGRGYWRGWGDGELDADMRILGAADVFDALSAERPYRGALEPDEVFRIMDPQKSGLDGACVEALRARYSGETSSFEHGVPRSGVSQSKAA